MKHRNVEYSVYANTYLRLYFSDGKCPISSYPNGEKYISIPKPYLTDIDSYAKIVIDRLYDWRDHWVAFETRERLK